MFWGYRAGPSSTSASYVFAAPARSDELVLDRRRRDLTLLVLFATAVGAIAAFWLSGIAARVLARDLELSRIEVARAERVVAWGEMARQIAHEIKNPLTPLRLGVRAPSVARVGSRVPSSTRSSTRTCRADPLGDRPAGHGRPHLQPLRRCRR